LGYWLAFLALFNSKLDRFYFEMFFSRLGYVVKSKNELVQRLNKNLLKSGTTVAGGAISQLKQEVSKPIISLSECNKLFPTAINENHICAGRKNLGKDTCQVCIVVLAVDYTQLIIISIQG
jgi:hypothetical protein